MESKTNPMKQKPATRILAILIAMALVLMVGAAQPATAGVGDGEATWTIQIDGADLIVDMETTCLDLADLLENDLIDMIEEALGGTVIIVDLPPLDCDEIPDGPQEFSTPVVAAVSIPEATWNSQFGTVNYDGPTECTKNNLGWAHGQGVFMITWGSLSVDGRSDIVRGSATIGEGGPSIGAVVQPYQDGNGPAAKTRCNASIRAGLEVGQAMAEAKAQGYGISEGSSSASLSPQGLRLSYSSSGTGASAGDVTGCAWAYVGNGSGSVDLAPGLVLRFGMMTAEGTCTTLPTVPNIPIDAFQEIIDDLIEGHMDELP